MYRTDEDIRRKMVQFGYNNENGHELISRYCEINDCKSAIMKIQNNVQMKDFVYNALNWFHYHGGGSINGETLSDIRANIRDSKMSVQRNRDRHNLMRDIAMGKIPRRF